MKKLLSLFICLSFFGFSQNELKATFTPAEDFTYAFLYKMTPSDPVFINNAKIDDLGQCSIKFDSLAEPGIYKIIYALPPEANNFDFIYNGKEDIELTFNLKNGVEFLASNENKLWASYLKSMDIINRTISNFYSKESTDSKAFNDIFNTLKETQKAYENSSINTLVNTFIKANSPYIPSQYEDLKTYSSNLKMNYFNQVDFDNPLLQCSTFINDRVDGFIFNLIESPDDSTYKSHIDIVAEAISKSAIKTRRNILEKVWDQFAKMGKDEIAIYMSDLYLMAIADEMKDLGLTQRLSSFKNTSLGATAPDFEISNPIGKSIHLSELSNSDNYLLIFWSSTCGHCLQELPQVKTLMQAKPNFKVIAFGIEDNNTGWSQEIKNYPDFMHTIGLGKWDNPVVNTYGISATPSYFILDKAKKVIAKPYDLEQLKLYLGEK